MPPDIPPEAPKTDATDRAFVFTSSDNLVDILNEINASLLISTYQAGRLVVVGVNQGRLIVSLHSFEHAMGLAVGGDQIVLGSQSQIWFLKSQPDIAARIEPP